MAFNSERPFKTLSEFDPTRNFEVLGFDSKKTFQILPDKEEIHKIVKAELLKIKPRFIETERIVHVPIQLPPTTQKIKEVVKEVIIREVEKPRKQDDTQEKRFLELTDKIKLLEDQLENMRQVIPMIGGSGVIGIPNPEGNNGKVLTVVSNQPKWGTAGASGSSDAYTPSNVTTDRSFDADSTSIDELADILGSLIVSLQGAGIIQ